MILMLKSEYWQREMLDRVRVQVQKMRIEKNRESKETLKFRDKKGKKVSLET